MKTFLSGLFLLGSVCSRALAQTTLSGSVRDGTGKGISFANVLLLHARDSALVKGAVNDESGAFHFENLRAGTYRVAATAVGFHRVYSAPFSLESGPGTHQLPHLVAQIEAYQLAEVQVLAKKPLFEQQMDRLVINVASSITAAGSTVLDVLERAPGVAVDRMNNGLSLNGKPGALIMVNGKLNRLPMSAVIQMLSGMNAGNVEKIELIGTPPAGFDAEGNAGLINIVLKKNELYGTNGSYSLNAGYGKYERLGGTFALNHRSERLNLYGDYVGQMNHFMALNSSSRRVYVPGRVAQTDYTTDRDYRAWSHNARFGLDYAVNARTTLSSMVSAFSQRQNQLAENNAQTSREGVPFTRVALTDREINHSWNYTANVNVRHRPKTGQEWSADVDYIFFFNNNPHEYQFTTYFLTEGRQEPSLLSNTKRTPLRLWVAKGDYSRSVGGFQWEVGLKGTVARFDNTLRFEQRQNDVWVPDETLSSQVRMDERILAAYGSVRYQLNKKTKGMAGLRYEHTNTDLRAADGRNLVYRDYGNFFPSVSFSHDFTKKNSLLVAYSRRINRPTFANLASAFTFLEPNAFLIGNEKLLPTLSNNLQTTYRFGKNVLLTGGYTRFRNAISANMRVLTNENRQITQPINIARMRTYSVALSVPWNLTTWWQTQTSLEGVRQEADAETNGDGLRQRQQYVRVNGAHTFLLPGAVTAEVSGFYQSKSLVGLLNRRPFGALNLGLQKKLSRNRGTLRLSGEDVLWTKLGQVYIDNPVEGYSTELNLRIHNRLVRLTYTRNFGNQKVVVNSKRVTGSDEERKRVN
ncbi:MAG: TonB-dependent receptor family protein [Cytophagaceae bacterium]|nr:TonB-dependent receptor family protein [Cytophagaceae bacterium]